MKSKLENKKGCSQLIKIEVDEGELKPRLEQIYKDIRKNARISGFRPGRAPKDLIEKQYGQTAQEELLKRTIPEYYLKVVKEEKLSPVAPPDIENVQFKNNMLSFDARVDLTPEVKLKSYRNLKITKTKIKVDKAKVDEVLDNLRKSKAKPKSEDQEKEVSLPPADDELAKGLGFKTLDELREAIDKNLHASAQMNVKSEMERQLVDELLKRAHLEAPQSLVNNQIQELLRQLKTNQMMQGEKKEDIESKEKQIQDIAKKEAVRRVKISFILQRIAQQENIQVTDEDIDKRTEAIAQSSAQSPVQVREYLQKQHLIPSLEAELKSRKTIDFLLSEAQIYETK